MRWPAGRIPARPPDGALAIQMIDEQPVNDPDATGGAEWTNPGEPVGFNLVARKSGRQVVSGPIPPGAPSRREGSTVRAGWTARWLAEKKDRGTRRFFQKLNNPEDDFLARKPVENAAIQDGNPFCCHAMRCVMPPISTFPRQKLAVLAPSNFLRHIDHAHRIVLSCVAGWHAEPLSQRKT